MFKKYLIRIVGSLCILGALAMMFVPSWVNIKDIDRRDLRNLRTDATNINSAVVDALCIYAQNEDDFKDELKDYDLPYTRSSIKSRGKEIAKLTDELLNDSVSLKELLVLSVKAPGLIKDAENLVDCHEAAETVFSTTASYVLLEGTQAQNTSEISSKQIQSAADTLETTTQDMIDEIAPVASLTVLLAVVLILILALGAAAAVTHICNKVRWLKYIFAVLLVCLVVGSCVAFPMVTDMLSDFVVDSAFEDMTLQIAVAPFIAVVLAIVPIVLDITCENKKRNKLAEE